MKRGILAAGLICTVVLFTGCSSFSPEVTGIKVDKKGTVTEVIKENFGEAYYNEDELKNTIDNEVNAYNSQYGEKSVKKGSLKVKNGEALLTMKYNSYKDYAEFNDVGFYVGDIKGAIQAGYPFAGSFHAVTEGKTEDQNDIWGSSIMSGINYNTVVVNEALLIDVPGTIRYVSDNVKVTDKSEAVTETNGIAYVLYE